MSIDNCPLFDSPAKYYQAPMKRTFRAAFLSALDSSGLSITDIAKRSGVSKDLLYKLRKRETATTNVEDASKIAECFGSTLTEFIEVSDSDSESSAEKPAYLDISARLRLLRNAYSKKGSSQKEWAENHGFNPTRYNNWEKGARRIPIEEAEKLCDAYGLTLDFIYRGRRDGLSESSRNKLSSTSPTQ